MITPEKADWFERWSLELERMPTNSCLVHPLADSIEKAKQFPTD
jgi:hypothetical protein